MCVLCVHSLVLQSLSHMAFCAPGRIRAVISGSSAIWGGIITSHLVFKTDTTVSIPSLAHSLYLTPSLTYALSLLLSLALNGSISGSTLAVTQLTLRKILFVVYGVSELFVVLDLFVDIENTLGQIWRESFSNNICSP